MFVECFVCADKCNDLTSELGCANDECLQSCRNCVTGVDWDDYNGGQNNQCQCHNNGCDQCPQGWFKVDYDFPCVQIQDSCQTWTDVCNIWFVIYNIFNNTIHIELYNM